MAALQRQIGLLPTGTTWLGGRRAILVTSAINAQTAEISKLNQSEMCLFSKWTLSCRCLNKPQQSVYSRHQAQLASRFHTFSFLNVVGRNGSLAARGIFSFVPVWILKRHQTCFFLHSQHFESCEVQISHISKNKSPPETKPAKHFQGNACLLPTHLCDDDDGQHIPFFKGQVLLRGALEVVSGHTLGALRPGSLQRGEGHRQQVKF